jgi:hypothetical protein
MANALEYAGYDYRFEVGEGGHACAMAARCSRSLRWLWRKAEGERS